jgi:predicted NodU family carbamoyl transferase
MKMSQQSRFYDYDEVLDTIDMSHSSDYNVYFKCCENLHRYPKEIVTDPTAQKWIASTVQNVIESFMLQLIAKYNKDRSLPNIVFSGGLAYNTLLCNKIADKCTRLYVPSHPGDAGSAYGAILQHTHTHVKLHNGVMYDEEKVR